MARTSTPTIHACACGREFFSRAGASTHGRTCPVERARSAAYVAALEAGDDTPHLRGNAAARAALLVLRGTQRQAQADARVERQGGHRGPARTTLSARFTDGQLAVLDQLVATGYAGGRNAVLARLLDEAAAERLAS